MTTRSTRALVGAGGLLAAGAVAGAVLAGSLSASAASSGATSTTTPGYGAPAGSPGGTGARPDVRGPDSVRPGETRLTGAAAAKAKAAALEAVPGGTVYRVETDADGATYEAHMSKADGSLVTVKLDKNFAVVAVQDGMGAGGPGGAPRSSSDSNA